MSHVQGIPSLKVCQSPAHPNPNYHSFPPTGVLMSAKSAAIGMPILVWMFSILPMPKVCRLAVTYNIPHSPAVPFSRVLQRLRLLQGTHVPYTCVLISLTDHTGNSNSGQKPILRRTWLHTRTRGGRDVVEHRFLTRFPGSRQPIGGQSTLSTRSPYP